MGRLTSDAARMADVVLDLRYALDGVRGRPARKGRGRKREPGAAKVAAKEVTVLVRPELWVIKMLWRRQCNLQSGKS